MPAGRRDTPASQRTLSMLWRRGVAPEHAPRAGRSATVRARKLSVRVACPPGQPPWGAGSPYQPPPGLVDKCVQSLLQHEALRPYIQVDYTYLDEGWPCSADVAVSADSTVALSSSEHAV